MKILARIEKNTSSWFLIAIVFLFFLLRLPSLFEPLWYGDEGIYQAMGMAMREGKLLYAQIWDNKTPLLYVVYEFFSSDQFSIRFASLLTGITSIFIFFLLARRLFTNIKTVFATTTLYAVLFGLPLLEGNIANAENFMLPLILLGGFVLVASVPKIQPTSFIFAGMLLSTAFLFKIVAIFDFAAFLLFLFLILYTKLSDWHLLAKKLAVFIIAFTLPIILVFLYFFIRGAFDEFYRATFGHNVGYVGYGNNFLIPQGLLIAKLLLLAGVSLTLFIYRKLFTPSVLFIVLWFSFSVFNAFFAQRPYTHYLLVLLPSFCLLIGLLLSKNIITEHNQQKKGGIIRRTMAVMLFASIVIIAGSFRLSTKTHLYYQNFLDFTMHKKSVSSYQAFFDRNTPRDYEIAHFLKNHIITQDTIFIWGNNAQLYTLIEKAPQTKYTVAYHITASDKSRVETQKQLDELKPRFIIVISKDPMFPKTVHYQERILIKNATIYERIF